MRVKSDMMGGIDEAKAEELQAAASEWSWKRFDRDVRIGGGRLLERIGEFEAPILIAGSQRSGTTMLGKVLADLDSLDHFDFARWPELAAALVLCGAFPLRRSGRTVFQTTYVDEAYREYLDLEPGARVIWLVRNPHSVVTSMVYNWSRFALSTTYRRIGFAYAPSDRVRRARWFSGAFLPSIDRACAVYNAKVAQLVEVHANMIAEQLLVVDYDDLVENPHHGLSRIFGFLELSDDPGRVADRIHRGSKSKMDRLKPHERERIADLCGGFYARAKTYTG